VSVALRYHEQTKHHFNRFARSLGRLDWASQPDPFRRYSGAPLIELPRHAMAATVSYHALFAGGGPSAPVTIESIGEFLRCAMGLSAWKQFGASRWALRVNPSSGNLHPTETYIVHGGRVCHYAVREHALEVAVRAVGPGPLDAADHLEVAGLTRGARPVPARMVLGEPARAEPAFVRRGRGREREHDEYGRRQRPGAPCAHVTHLLP
jgi:hypothetical protein